MIRYINFAILIGCFCVVQAQAQDLHKDIQRNQDYLAFSESYVVEFVSSHVFDDDRPNEILGSVSVRKQGENFQYQMSGLTSLIFPDAFLMIYHQNREMVYQKANMPRPDISKKLEALFDMIEEVSLQKNTEQYREYKVTLINPLYDYALVQVNNKSDLLTQVQYYYSERSQGDPQYLEQRMEHKSLPGNAKPISLSKYIRISKHDLKVQPAFDDYTLIY